MSWMRTRIRRSGAALAALLALVLSLVVGVSPVSAVAFSEPYQWRTSGPGDVRFSGVATSLNGSIVYAVVDTGTWGISPQAKGYRSFDSGETWAEVASMPALYWASVDVSANGQVIIAAGSGYVSGVQYSEVYRSTDGGSTWSVVFAPIPNRLFSEVAVSADGQKFIARSNFGVEYSPDQGANWTNIRVGTLAGADISGDGSTIMVTEYGVGIRKSTDQGTSWTVVKPDTTTDWTGIELSNDGLTAIAVSKTSGVSGAAFFTRDGGTFWTQYNPSPAFANNQLAVGSVSPDGNTMVIASYGTSPNITTDAGNTWVNLPSSATGIQREWWTGVAVSNPDSTSTLNNVQSKVYFATEGNADQYNRLLRFGLRPRPVVAMVSRNFGRASGGRTVTIHGSDFANATSVTFGGVPATSFSVIGDYQISAVSPAHAAGSVDVIVTTGVGSSSAVPESIYTYVNTPPPTISSIDPARVASKTKSQVMMSGTNFEEILDVRINGIGVGFDEIDSTHMSVYLDPNTAGPATLEVETETGIASATITFDDTLNPPERKFFEITSFNPSGESDMEITALDTLANGDLLIAGAFHNAGNVPAADCVARWDGTTWSGFGSDGFDDGALECDGSLGYGVLSIDVSPEGYIYVVGELSIRGDSAHYAVIMWDGSRWRGLLDYDDFDSYFRPTGMIEVSEVGTQLGLFVVSANRAYLYGNFGAISGAPGTDFFAMWNGSEWTSVNSVAGTSAFNEPIYNIAVSPTGSVYVTGDFTDAGGDTNADYLARWNGSRWAAVGDDGSGGPILKEWNFRTVAVHVVDGKDEVYVAGFGTYVDDLGDVLYFANGKWTTLIDDEFMSLVGYLHVAASGAVVGAGLISDSTTRSIDTVAILSDGKWKSFSQQTSNIDYLFLARAIAVTDDGRLILSVYDSVLDNDSTKIVVFDDVSELKAAAIPEPVVLPQPVVTALPRTGAELPTGFALLALAVGVVVRSATRRRRPTVR